MRELTISEREVSADLEAGLEADAEFLKRLWEQERLSMRILNLIEKEVNPAEEPNMTGDVKNAKV